MMILNKIICDRCGVEICNEPHPPIIVKRDWKKYDKATVSSGYRDTDKIHLCKNCTEQFQEFLKNER